MTIPTLPIIDVSPYLDDNSSKESRRIVAEQLHVACRDVGFFYLKVDGYVDRSESEELMELQRRFFQRPKEEKEDLAISKQDNARGYQKVGQNVTLSQNDHHEALDFYRPVENPDATKPIWGENQWPSNPPEYREKMEAWVRKMKHLGMMVMKAMSDGLKMTEEEWKGLEKSMDDSFWCMRCIGYPSLPGDKGHKGISCGEHRDYGCLTLLFTDPTPSALQVLYRDPNGPDHAAADASLKGYWIDANPIPGAAVVNIGDMVEIWTNGLYKSTLHRVIHRGDNYRVSVPFFFEPNWDTKVEPLAAAKRIQEQMKEGENGKEAAKHYEPIVYGDHLKRKVGGNFAKYDQ
ncbi:hypothetical protein PROFUN_14669 [Planoprotostelium fungivorum]|uniref:Fe2OG dioxygenase domain-containing protein n=1 Tax=Planoprotostelium fungivorum TaxID=1890364 RepID=A0A2P6MZ34_9EUKA|nr:hypothetical protein PROFUN_14669 [Planoprotostelium fungivorum]